MREPTNRGGALLRAWRLKEGLSQAQASERLAAELGRPGTRQARWSLYEVRATPSLEVATAIERITAGAVPATSWFQRDGEVRPPPQTSPADAPALPETPPPAPVDRPELDGLHDMDLWADLDL